MTEVTLMEDTCLEQGKDFEKEKQALLSQGYVILSEFVHPAVGKTCRLEKKNPFVSKENPHIDHSYYSDLARSREKSGFGM